MTLRSILASRGISLAQVQVSAGVSVSTLHRIFRTGRPPTRLYLAALAKFLKMPVADVRAAILEGAPVPEAKP